MHEVTVVGNAFGNRTGQCALDGMTSCLGRDRGFTVTEVLVALCILAIAIGACYQVIAGCDRSIGLTSQRQAALDLAATRIEELRDMPYSKLPPEQVIVPRTISIHGRGELGCHVRIRADGITPGSIRVYRDGRALPKSDYGLDADGNSVYLDPSYAGDAITVDYTLSLRDRQEDRLLPDSMNCAVKLLERPLPGSLLVEFADGMALRGKLDVRGRIVCFSHGNAGRTARFRYLGSTYAGTARGVYLKEDLSGRSDTDAGVKQITLDQVWVDSSLERHLRLTCLRTR